MLPSYISTRGRSISKHMTTTEEPCCALHHSKNPHKSHAKSLGHLSGAVGLSHSHNVASAEIVGLLTWCLPCFNFRRSVRSARQFDTIFIGPTEAFDTVSCPSIHLPASPTIHYLSAHVSVCMSVALSFCPSTHLTLCPPVCPSVHLFTLLSACPSVCPSVCVSPIDPLSYGADHIFGEECIDMEWGVESFKLPILWDRLGKQRNCVQTTGKAQLKAANITTGTDGLFPLTTTRWVYLEKKFSAGFRFWKAPSSNWNE